MALLLSFTRSLIRSHFVVRRRNIRDGDGCGVRHAWNGGTRYGFDGIHLRKTRARRTARRNIAEGEEFGDHIGCEDFFVVAEFAPIVFVFGDFDVVERRTRREPILQAFEVVKRVRHADVADFPNRLLRRGSQLGLTRLGQAPYRRSSTRALGQYRVAQLSHRLGRIKHTYKSDISSSLPWQGFANYRFRSFVRICHISPAFGVPRLRRSANAFVCNGNHSSSWLVEIAVQKRPIPKKPPANISYHRQSSQSLRQPFMRTLSMSTPRSVDCSCMTNMQYGAWRQLHSSLLNSSRHRLIKASFFYR